jgi:hypothetical protein
LEQREHRFRCSSKPLARRPSYSRPGIFFLALSQDRLNPPAVRGKLIEEFGIQLPLKKEQPGTVPGCVSDAECVTSLGFGIPEDSKAIKGCQHQ